MSAPIPPKERWDWSSTSARSTSRCLSCLSSWRSPQPAASGRRIREHCHGGARRGAGRDEPRFRSAQLRLFCRRQHAADQRERVPDRDGGYPESHRQRQRPDKAILALGYAGWASGQLEREIQSNSWLNCPADYDIVFDGDLENKYARALHSLGVHPLASRGNLRSRIALARREQARGAPNRRAIACPQAAIYVARGPQGAARMLP